MARQYFVYTLISRSGNALYTGMTNDLARRLDQHRTGRTGPRTQKYRIFKLVYFEVHQDIEIAFLRERRIKRWRRQWKIDLIKSANPGWRDLSTEIPHFV